MHSHLQKFVLASCQQETTGALTYCLCLVDISEVLAEPFEISKRDSSRWPMNYRPQSCRSSGRQDGYYISYVRRKTA